MNRFYAERLLKICRLSDLLNQFCQVGYSKIKLSRALQRHNILTEVKQFGEDCQDLGLVVSAAETQRLSSGLERESTGDQLSELAHCVLKVLESELSTSYFFKVGSEEVEYLNNPRKGWELILERFPGAIDDVEEARKCLGLGRYTACVFHLMRIMEVGLRSLGKTLNDPALDPKRNPSWEAVLGKCDKELQKPIRDRSAEWCTDDAFFSTATANLRAVKDAWRNPTMHVERLYDGEQAQEVYSAARAFMRHLATKLSE